MWTNYNVQSWAEHFMRLHIACFLSTVLARRQTQHTIYKEKEIVC